MKNWNIYIRVGGKTGQTFFKNNMEHDGIKETMTGDVCGQTVYETLFIAVEQALNKIPEPSKVSVFSNNLAFIKGISNGQHVDDMPNLGRLLREHIVTFDFQKMEKISQEEKGPMAVRIDVEQEEPEFYRSAEEMSHARRINLECAKDIMDFYDKDIRIFADYAALRTHGKDAWSEIGISAFERNCKKTFDTAKKYLPDVMSAVYAMRWYQRGLTLEDAIRKVLVDEEQKKATRVTVKQTDAYKQLELSDFLAV